MTILVQKWMNQVSPKMLFVLCLGLAMVPGRGTAYSITEDRLDEYDVTAVFIAWIVCLPLDAVLERQPELAEILTSR